MIRLDEVGATCTAPPGGGLHLHFGVYLPGISFSRGYRLRVRVIHERDQFLHDVDPRDFWMSWVPGSEYDLWQATVDLADAGRPAGSHFGDVGRYLYRYQLSRGDTPVTFWFADPFGRAAGQGTLSAVSAPPKAAFPWSDAGFGVPPVDDMVVYELNVREFNGDFDGVVDQLSYLWDLGVNVLELMPVTNVKEQVEWGYTPLGYFAPDERLGSPEALKRLIDSAHAHNVAVIVDAVYGHAHPEFPYDQVLCRRR